jgi:hypothetical protein
LGRADCPGTYHDLTLDLDMLENASGGVADTAATISVEQQPVDVGVGHDGEVCAVNDRL